LSFCSGQFFEQFVPSDLSRAIADLQERKGTSQDDIGFCKVAAGRFAPSAISRYRVALRK
jgi:hypothetical protein